MKIIKLIILSFLLSFNLLNSQQILWQKTYSINSQTGSYPIFVTKANDNSIVVIGKLNGMPITYPYPFILKIDNSGNQEWLKYIYTDNYYIDDYSLYFTQNNDLSYTLTAGKLDTPQDEWMWFYKFDLSKNGDSLNMIMRTSNDSKYIKGIPNYYKNNDGTFIYSLHQQLGSFFEGIFFVKTDSLGSIIWKKQLKDDSLTLKPISRPKTDWDNGFIFISKVDSTIGTSFTSFVLIKTDNECNEIFRKSIKSDFLCKVNEIFPTRDSGYVILSRAGSSLTKINRNFVKLWQKTLYGDTITNLYSMVENENGDFICAGSVSKYDKYGRDDTSSTKGWIIKLNKKGEKVWDLKLGKDGIKNDFRYITNAGNDDYFVVGNVKNTTIIYKIKDSSTGILESENKNKGLITPNPVTDFLSINSNITLGKIEIYSVFGLKVLETKCKEKIDVSSLLPGVYFVRVGDKVIKFIKI